MKTYKDKSTTIKHEYLIATLRDGSEGEVFLRMERRIQSSAEAFGQSIIRRLRSEPIPPSDSGVALFKKSVVDEVSIVTPNLHKQQLVEHVVFEDKNRVSLPQLIVLACAINDHSNEYHLREKNCYWFCYIIGELLQRLSTPSFPPPSARGRQGTTWLGLPAGGLWQEVNFDVLLSKYETMWNIFEHGVCSITEILDVTDTNGSWQIESVINHPDNKHPKEVREQVQEEKKSVEGAERHMEEAECCMEEEKRRAEESDEIADSEEPEKSRLEEKKEMELRFAELEAKLVQATGKGLSDISSRQRVDFHHIAT